MDLDPYSHGRVCGLPGLPAYRIYTEELDKVAPLNSDAMYALQAGDASLSEIPDNLSVDDRRDWLKERLSPKSRERLDMFRRIAANIRLATDDDSSDAAAPEGDDR